MQDIAQSRRAGLAELNGVVAVAAHRNFRRAAAEVGLSPSALSHAVAMLEGRLGVRLFHRTTRSVALTEAGEQFLHRVRPALQEIAAAMESVNEFRATPTGVLRINASLAAAQLIFRPVVVPFVRRYSDMQVDLVAEGKFVDIVAEGFDAGIRLRESVPGDMVAVPFGPPQRLLVVGSRHYFKKHGRPRVPSDLHAHACVRSRLPSGTIFRWDFERRGEALAVDVKGPLILLGAPSLALDAALAGVALAYLAESAVGAHVAAGRLIPVLEDWSPSFSGLCLYYPHRRGSAGLRAFIEQLKAAFFSAKLPVHHTDRLALKGPPRRKERAAPES